MRIKKWIKHVVGYFAIILLTMSGLFATTPVVSHADTVEASAAFAIDAHTGQVLYNQNGDQRLAVASMSKLLTVAVIEHEIASGNLKWSTKVKITEQEATLSQASGYSNVPLQAGKSYTVKQLTRASLIKSADAATIALSRAAGKTTPQFVQMMGAMAQRIGLRNYRLYNGVGLENKDMGTFKLPKTAGSAENEMTAKDVAKLAQYLINNYPKILQITKEQTLQWDGQTYPSSNEFLTGNLQLPQGVTIDGLKTGTSDQAGQCFVSTGTYQGHRIITVVMHANDRFAQTQRVYQEILNNWVPQNQHQGLTVGVAHGQQHQVRVQTKKAVTVWQPKQQAVKAQFTIAPHFKAGQQLNAPLKKNTRVGRLRYPGLLTLNGQPLQFGVYPASEVNRTGFLGWLETFF